MVTGPKQAELIAVLGDIPISDTERDALARVSEFEDAAVEIIVGLLWRVFYGDGEFGASLELLGRSGLNDRTGSFSCV